MAEKNAFTLNWRQAVIDVLLIVIGVSIALAADSWLGDRTEQARTDQLLDALEDEWTVELERIDAHIDMLSQAKTAIARIIKTHDDGLGGLSNQEAAALFDGYGWSTFKSSDGALSTLMVDGVQNVDDRGLRMAIASWRTVLAELDAEQAALRELGTLKIRSLAARVAQESGERFSHEAMENDYWSYGMESGAFSRAAIADDEWVANQRHLLNLLYAYRIQLAAVREILERNLTLLRERARN
jgi:hypothetical protein